GGAGAPEQAVRDIDRIQDLLSARQNVERIAGAQLGDLPPRTANAVTQLVRRALRPNLAYDDAETRRRLETKRAQVKDVLLQVRKGEKIIGDGEQVTKTHLLIFHALRAAGRASEADQVRWGGGLFAALLCAAVFEFGRRNLRKFRPRSRDVFLLAALMVGQLFVVKGGLSGADALHDIVRDQLPAQVSAYATLATVLGAGLGGALILPLLALLLSPLLEALFGYVTDIELLKLANFNHPVLKDLIVQAPGTYHHAILIGQLVEAAARDIGAN